MKTWLLLGALSLGLSACAEPSQHESHSAPPEEVAMSYEAEGWAEKTLPELVEALEAREVTSRDLLQAYMDRIQSVDRAGPMLQSVLAVNPLAAMQAMESDMRRVNGETIGPLDGIPILLKDNIESADPVATTAGALALKDNVTERDSPLVAGLRAQGAVILGKANLSQWANFRSNDSMSGWSALGGQVRNPHILDRNPCGSSSGSGAAVAASLTAGAVGTETNGSIICPSNVNGIVGFKPTVGLVSQEFIIPISPSQDTAGPMTKTVKGAALMLNAMATGEAKTDYVTALDALSLSGKRVGVMRFSQGQNPDIVERFNSALEVLEAQGATLIDIAEFSPNAENFWADSLTVLQYEFKASLNAYLETVPPSVSTRSLSELIAFNETNSDVELALFDQSLFIESEEKGALTDPDYLSAKTAIQRAAREEGIDRLLATHSVDMLVSPSGPVSPVVDPINGDIWPGWAGAGYLAAIAGYPHLTIPMGDVHGIPIGVSIMGAKDADAQILSYGYAYEQASQMRVDPKYLKTAEARPEIAKAMALPMAAEEE